MYLVQRNVGCGGSVRDSYVGVLGNYLLINTLSIKIDIGTALHNLGSQVLVQIDGTSLTSKHLIGVIPMCLY